MLTDDKIKRVEKLRKRLRTRPANVRLIDITARTGLSKSWLTTLLSECYGNPHDRLLDRLDAFLNGLSADA